MHDPQKLAWLTSSYLLAGSVLADAESAEKWPSYTHAFNSSAAPAQGKHVYRLRFAD